MITNVDYLIQKYAEAREKMNDSNMESSRQYWRGSMDTFHNLLSTAFEDWNEFGTVGYFVFMEGCSYDEGLTKQRSHLLTVDC